MPMPSSLPWLKTGTPAATPANYAHRFIEDYITPLCFWRTNEAKAQRMDEEVRSAEQFWQQQQELALGSVRIRDVRIIDWFPRAPGVFWSARARRAREEIWMEPALDDRRLGRYYAPRSKMGLIEHGGIGTIRLLPKKVDDQTCLLATAVSGTECHAGIPLAIPQDLYLASSLKWGDYVELRGRVRFLHEVGLDDVAGSVHHARPLVVLVDEIKGSKAARSLDRIKITPVALFEPLDDSPNRGRGSLNYTFVHCHAGSDSDLDMAGEWIEQYAKTYSGRVVTNFDQQRPLLAGAPLSYQRLVVNTYDRATLVRIGGDAQIARVDTFIQHQHIGTMNTGHHINVGGSAIINIDSTLNNVKQTIGSAGSLNVSQRTELESLVEKLKTELDHVKAAHAEEAQAVASALEKVVAQASKPAAERKSNMLQLSAKGLKDAAELLKDIAPAVLSTAGSVAKFIVGIG